MNFEQKTCDICHCQWFTTAQESKLQLKVNGANLLPGSEGCVKLNDNLRVYFIATRLLRLANSEYIKLLQTLNAPSLSLKGSNFRSKVLPYSIVCARCELIINEALELHDQVVRLQHKIKKLGETLFEIKAIANCKLAEEKPTPSSSRQRSSTSSPFSLNAATAYNNEEENTTAKDMLGISMACLGKMSIPTPKRTKGPAPKKLRNRSVITSHSPKMEMSAGVDVINEVVPDDDVLFKVEAEEVNADVEIQGVALGPYKEDDWAQHEAMDHSEVFHDESIDNHVILSPVHATKKENNSDADYEPEPNEDSSSSEDEEEDGSDPDFQLKNNAESSDESDKEDDFEDEVRVMDDGGYYLESASLIPCNKNQIESKCSTLPSGEIVFEFQCTACEKVFTSRNNLHMHTRNIHGFEVMYSCPKCPDLKFTRRSLVEHRNNIHGHICDKCGKQLKSRCNLFLHFEMAHKAKLTFVCPLCNKSFKKRSELRKHRAHDHKLSQDILNKLLTKMPHTPEEEEWSKTPCEECGKIFLSGVSLDIHLGKHERKKNLSKQEKQKLRTKCFYCWRNFRHHQRLFIHLKMSHPEESLTQQFFCEHEECGTSTAKLGFPSCSDLEYHLETKHKNHPVHKCADCGWPFLTTSALKTHKKNHFRVSKNKEKNEALKKTYKFQCWFCWEIFPDEARRNRHLKASRRHRRSMLGFFCDVEDCEHSKISPFHNCTELNEHLQNAHASDGEIHYCSSCSWGFTSTQRLAIHKLNHLHRKNSQYTCPSCGHISSKLMAMRNHFNTQHGYNIKLHKCPECGEGFNSLIGLRKHCQQAHKKSNDNEVKIPCDQCSRWYPNEATLKTHKYNAHQDRTCDECGEKFSNSVRYHRHRTIVHGRGCAEMCAICGKRVMGKSALILHQKKHEHKKYKCHVCHKRMADLDKIKAHIERVHRLDRQKKTDFVCGQCGKGFARKDTLDDHERVAHTQETWRVFICDKCGQRFSRKGYLKEHQQGDGCKGDLETIIV